MRDRTESVTRTPAAAALLTLVLTASAVAVVLASAPGGDKAVAALTYGLLVAAPAGVGVAVLARRPGDRFARALVIAGGLWSLTALQMTSEPVPYSIGRIAVWIAEGSVIYLLLAFPSGRLTTQLERWTWRAAMLLIGVLFVPTALVLERFPEPSEGRLCKPDCPENAFNVTSSTPGFVDDVVRPLREILTVVLMLAVIGILARRMRRAGPMLRSALAPVTAVAAFRALSFPFYFVMRSHDANSSSLEVITWVHLLALALIPLSFGAGLLVRRLYGAVALQAMALHLRADSTAADLRAGMAVALEDPSLRLLYWRAGHPGRWIDETGWPTGGPRGGPDRQVTEVTADGRRVAAIEHDANQAQDPEVMRAAGAYAVTLLENHRLVDELRASVSDLSDSRARIAAVSDEARRRIERDLHDGAQQRLVALRIKLARQSERVRPISPEAADELEVLGAETEETIDEVRALAHGIYPSLLAERGLSDALRAAVLSAPIDTSLVANKVGRYSPEVETTVYFACLEALQNAAKHARATHVDIALSVDGSLAFSVSDDGAGFNGDQEGAGLTNLRDRMTAVGGEVTIESERGQGTRVSGSIPVARGPV